MPDYARMYHILCRAASGALDMLPDTKENAAGRYLLQFALYLAEELYIRADEEEEETDGSLPQSAP